MHLIVWIFFWFREWLSSKTPSSFWHVKSLLMFYDIFLFLVQKQLKNKLSGNAHYKQIMSRWSKKLLIAAKVAIFVKNKYIYLNIFAGCSHFLCGPKINQNEVFWKSWDSSHAQNRKMTMQTIFILRLWIQLLIWHIVKGILIVDCTIGTKNIWQMKKERQTKAKHLRCDVNHFWFSV